MLEPDSVPDASGGQHRLRWEIAAALAFKAVVLWALWFAVFRHDPTVPGPSVAELFAPAHASVQLEKKP